MTIMTLKRMTFQYFKYLSQFYKLKLGNFIIIIFDKHLFQFIFLPNLVKKSVIQ
jgi:hypothetical protein